MTLEYFAAAGIAGAATAAAEVVATQIKRSPH
jgi:hypothetical protein